MFEPMRFAVMDVNEASGIRQLNANECHCVERYATAEALRLANGQVLLASVLARAKEWAAAHPEELR